jgi:hypothetical protein
MPRPSHQITYHYRLWEGVSTFSCNKTCKYNEEMDLLFAHLTTLFELIRPVALNCGMTMRDEQKKIWKEVIVFEVKVPTVAAFT